MVSITSFCSLLILLSLIGTINGQTCHGKSQYDLCSSNHGCGCLQLSISDDVSICGILGVSCSRLQPCQSPDDTCERADHICVRHPRCSSSTPLCYPLSMIDHRLCPPSSSLSISSTTTASTPTWNTTRFPSWNTTGFPSWNATGSTPTWNATGFPSWNATGSTPTWNATWSPSWNATGSTPTWNATWSPSWNATGSTPTWNTTGFPSWNATGSTLTWNATVFPTWNVTVPVSTNGSAPVPIYSYYTNALSTHSSVFPETVNRYFQAINIIVKTSGHYNFTSSSSMDTSAALYKDGFDFYYLNRYLISSSNTFNAYRQFKLSHNLTAGVPYTLLFTTIPHGQTGVFTVVASGPDHLRLF